MTTTEVEQNQQALYNAIYNLGVTAERKRVNSWLESGLKNKWQVRDGIKSGKSFTESHHEEINNFYSMVDEKLDTNSSFTSVQQKNIVENKESDHYQKLEAKDFYDEVDSLLRK
tara:strand:- start:1516 stop:1857 length:342 start_codon:yes stop_codon:yes gene_type:complete